MEPIPLPLLEIAERARREVDLLTREIGEIEMLVNQARTEATRHEQKRAIHQQALIKHDLAQEWNIAQHWNLDRLKTGDGLDRADRHLEQQ